MPVLPEAWLEEVRQRSDIVDVVSEHVHLTQKGKRWWGLCPFHHEKTPSFSVDQETQLYYCFGCHVGGTVFGFVMAMERLEFYEAAIELAERARVPLPEQARTGVSAEEREKMYETVKAAARWFHDRLWTPAGEEARSYLKKRGVSDSTIRRFGVGVSGEGWRELTEHMTARGYPEERLKAVGLAGDKSGRYYDTFRQRVIFPILNAQSKVIAFGGRVLGDGQPKYLNSPDTPLFNKRFQLYGLHFLKAQRALKRLYLVEGYMDVVSLTQSGVAGCVATLGTAITLDQAKLMKRYCADIAVCYDGDDAGQAATQKALSLLEEAGAEPRVLFLPDGLDPDDYMRKFGKDAFDSLPLKSATEYRLERAAASRSLADEEERTKFAIDAAQVLSRLKNPVEIETHVKKLAVQTGFSEEVLWRQIGQTARYKGSQGVNKNTAANNRYNKSTKAAEGPLAESVKYERQLVGFMARGYAVPDKTLTPADFRDPLSRRLAAFFMEEAGTAADAARLMDVLENEEERRVASEILSVEIHATPEEMPEYIRGLCVSLRKEAVAREIAELQRQRDSADMRAQIELGQRIQALNMEKRRLDAN